MKVKLLILKERIEMELRNIEKTVQQAQDAWKESEHFPDQQKHYLNSMALNLHSFYNGLEHIFEMIARQIDYSFPTGERWHRDLLEQMAKEIPKTRPAVISPLALSMLDDFLAFRHLVRNLYAFDLDADLLKQLLDRLPEALSHVKRDLVAFCQLLYEASNNR